MDAREQNFSNFLIYVLEAELNNMYVKRSKGAQDLKLNACIEVVKGPIVFFYIRKTALMIA